MCVDCGCREWTSCHHDLRHIAFINFDNALAVNPGLSAKEVANNISDGLDVWLHEQYEDTVKSMHAHPHVHITIEPYGDSK